MKKMIDKIVNVAAFCGGIPKADVKVYEVSTGTSLNEKSRFTCETGSKRLFFLSRS